MKRLSGPRRTPSNLSDSVQQRLNMYALAASAAGVGMLALAQPTEARIVYTPTHHVIGKNTYFALDLNHDGIDDFTISNSAHLFGNILINSIMVRQQGTNGVEDGSRLPGGTLLARALKPGKRISNAQRFYSRGEMVAQCDHGTTSSGPPCSYHPYHTLGNWINVKNRYLGLMFTVHGKAHYGWARLNVEVSKHPFKLTATLTGYAYETIPGKLIIAGKTEGPDDISVESPNTSLTAPTPEPATLGMLARGAPALSIWRREEPVGARSEPN